MMLMSVGNAEETIKYSEFAKGNDFENSHFPDFSDDDDGDDDDDDDIICLDVDDAPSCSIPKQANVSEAQSCDDLEPSIGTSQISRFLLKIVRMYLNDRSCNSPGCSGVLELVEKLKESMEGMKERNERLGEGISDTHLEIERILEENSELKVKMSKADALINYQRLTILKLELDLTELQQEVMRLVSAKQSHNFQRLPNSSPLLQCSTNIVPPEPVPTTKRSRNSAGKQIVARSNQALRKVARLYVDQRSGQNTMEVRKASSSLPAISPSLPQSQRSSTNRSISKRTRVRVDVPHVSGKSLIHFVAPISSPILDYPSECLNSKFGGPTDLTLEINTEPSDFLLTRKVQGVIKYCTVNGRRPKSVKVYCYLESASRVFHWTSSTTYAFAGSTKMKFDIVFSKDQEIAAYDRVVVFAFAVIDADKFVTERIILNLGQQARYVKDSAARISNLELGRQSPAESMETEYISSVKVKATGTNPHTIDSNFEVYRP